MQSRSYRAKIAERNNIFQEMKHLQLQKLNRATYRLNNKICRTHRNRIPYLARTLSF